MCHRWLFGTPGTMANVPIVNNTNPPVNAQYHAAVNKFIKNRKFL